MGASIPIEDRLETGCRLGRRTFVATGQLFALFIHFYTEKLTYIFMTGPRSRTIDIDHAGARLAPTDASALGTIFRIDREDCLHHA